MAPGQWPLVGQSFRCSPGAARQAADLLGKHLRGVMQMLKKAGDLRGEEGSPPRSSVAGGDDTPSSRSGRPGPAAGDACPVTDLGRAEITGDHGGGAGAGREFRDGSPPLGASRSPQRRTRRRAMGGSGRAAGSSGVGFTARRTGSKSRRGGVRATY